MYNYSVALAHKSSAQSIKKYSKHEASTFLKPVYTKYGVSKHNSTWYVYKCLSIVFTNIIINTHGYELYKYFTMVQFFEDFIEKKFIGNLL